MKATAPYKFCVSWYPLTFSLKFSPVTGWQEGFLLLNVASQKLSPAFSQVQNIVKMLIKEVFESSLSTTLTGVVSLVMCIITAAVISSHFGLFCIVSFGIDLANKEARVICFRAGSFDILFDVGWDVDMQIIVFYRTSCKIQTTARWLIQCCFSL